MMREGMILIFPHPTQDNYDKLNLILYFQSLKRKLRLQICPLRALIFLFKNC